MTMERERQFFSCMTVEGEPYKRDLPNQRRKIRYIQLMQAAYHSLKNRIIA